MRIIGIGTFGPMYSGIIGQAAINFLLRVKHGEVVGAITHQDLGSIDLVYGNIGGNGFGLAHIEEKHPEILPQLVTIIQYGVLIQKIDDRAYLEADDGRAIIRLDWDGNKKSWVVTAFKI